MRHILTSGQWIEVLPIQGLRAKHKDAAESAIKLYVAFDDKGQPDLSNMPLTMTIPKAQLHVIMAMCITSWSFELVTVDNESGEESVQGLLPKPQWQAEGPTGTILYEDSFGEIGIDDWAELEDFFGPYMEKVRRRPDPKGTTTASSNGTLPVRAARSRQG